ncbi:MFS transporter [Alkalibacter mobilis]|uniref:MFS transporter n=1 Tax=Alkalibacter mobilis TaxID=2787712 RepID=UPI00189DAFE7|nr:MFS transporter [Alkalibacter mobilis]MBF7096948.1 MFS transporter [Alkalibacter mobilis]
MKLTKEEISWILYDCGNSAYSIIITTAIFPIYFTSMASAGGATGASATAWWNYGNALATFIIVVLSPILGTIADYKNFKKRFFTFFASLGIGFTAFLAVIPQENWQILMILYVLTVAGFAGANIFYDAFLVDVSEDDNMDKVSSSGFAFGYISSVIPFILCIFLINFSGLDVILMTKLSFVITALWWGLFTLPMIKNVHQKHYIEREPKPVVNSFKRIFATFRNIRKYKVIAIFLLAYFFYIDGVDTIIRNAAVFGEQIGLDTTGLMIALLLTQIVAFPCAILYGMLAKKFTARNMIIFGIFTYFVVCLMAYRMKTIWDFALLGFMIASAQGGIQALSRSYFAKIVPKKNSNEFFGFYNILGKFAAIMGPILIGTITLITGDIRKAVMSLILLFGIGLILILRLPKEPERVEKI